MSAAAFSDRERRDRLRLARTQNVGPATFAGLIARFGSAKAALAEIPHLARRGGGSDIPRIPSESDIAHEIDSLSAFGGRLLCCGEAEYPAGLAALDPPPPLVSIAGRSEMLAHEMIAVVGARNASGLGRKLATQLAADLGHAGLVVVSGLARGIDAAAHEGALASGTVAVVAGGLDIIYPPENTALYERIRKDGVLVAEMAFGQTPQARHFPRRNRIISGLSRGVVVVEASEGSGSLITANFALEQGREVFAVPGSPLDPRAKGTNRLIRDGATLTESAADVLAVLAEQRSCVREPAGGEPAFGPLSDREAASLRRQIEELLGPAPIEIDDIARQTGSAIAAVLSVLLELELAGRVERHPGGKVSYT